MLQEWKRQSIVLIEGTALHTTGRRLGPLKWRSHAPAFNIHSEKINYVAPAPKIIIKLSTREGPKVIAAYFKACIFQRRPADIADVSYIHVR